MKDICSAIRDALLEYSIRLDGEVPTAPGQYHHIDATDAVSGRRLHAWYRLDARNGSASLLAGVWNDPAREKFSLDLDIPVGGGDSVRPSSEALERWLTNQQREAVTRIKEKLTHLKPADGSEPYLTRKSVKPVKGVFRDGSGTTYAPLLGSGGLGEIQSLQWIGGDGSKCFETGARVKGAAVPIGDLTRAERVLVCEGLATGLTLHEAVGLPVVCATSAGNLEPVVAGLRQNLAGCELLLCADNDEKPDGSNPGTDSAIRTAKLHQLRLVWPRFSIPDPGSDFNDLAATEGLNEVRRQVEAAWALKPVRATVTEAAQTLGSAHLDDRPRLRKLFMGQGLPAKALDAAARGVSGAAGGEAEAAFSQLKEILFDAEPALEEQDGRALAADTEEFLRRHIAAPPHYFALMTGFIAASHVHPLFLTFPLLHFWSPGEDSGKTNAAEAVGACCPRFCKTESVSMAALFRLIELENPTVLLDELDEQFERGRELVGLLNASHRRTGSVLRSAPVKLDGGTTDYVPRPFRVYTPIILAGVEGIPYRTLASRCISLLMRPASRAEVARLEKLDDDATAAAKVLQGRWKRWASDSQAALEAACKHQADLLRGNRRSDNRIPLATVAEVVGGDMPTRMAGAFETLWSDSALEPSRAYQLLADVISAFVDTSHGAVEASLSADDLTKRLTEMPGASYATANKGRPVDTDWVRSRLRKAFGFSTEKVREKDKTLWRYTLEQLKAIAADHTDRLLEAARASDKSDKVVDFIGKATPSDRDAPALGKPPGGGAA